MCSALDLDLATLIPERRQPVAGGRGQAVPTPTLDLDLATLIPERRQLVAGGRGRAVPTPTLDLDLATLIPERRQPVAGGRGQAVPTPTLDLDLATLIPERRQPVAGGRGRAVPTPKFRTGSPAFWRLGVFAILVLAGLCFSSPASEGQSEWLSGKFTWRASASLIRPATRPEDPCQSIKDPTVVFHEGRWHLFATIRSTRRTHQIEYLSFADWKQADAAPRQILKLTDGYFCAPQVFFFSPHRKWYLIYQATDTNRTVALQPAFSTSSNLADPASWTTPGFLYDKHPASVKGWIDFWIICDAAKAHLFFTSLDGRMWRAESRIADFPHGWSEPAVVLQADIFEASHTYKLKGVNQYLTLVEAQNSGRRYYKAYLAEHLDGTWQPLAATRAQPFASPLNVKDTGPHWTDSFSHGELLRAGIDERLEVDPANLRFLFQGVSDERKAGKAYGQIPWELGLLEQVP